MTDQELRLECLKLAHSEANVHHGDLKEIATRASAFYEFVAVPKAQPPEKPDA